MALAPGTRLGPYEIVAPLGAGGMGEVYQARDTRLDRTVAIKVLPPELSTDPERRARFEREAKTIAGLHHPHICTLHDIGTHEGATFLVMEHLAGETLAERLKKGPLALEHTLVIATEIADALAAAHRQGVIHRDLKPGNVMLTKAGATLLDFGLAKLKGHGEQPAAGPLASAPTQSTPLTGQGMIVGTLPYMAPEQLEGKEADARTDLWALGAMLYEMVTGTRAFEGTSAVGLMGAILERDPAPLTTRQPLTPPALDRLVRQCLAKAPDDRPDTAHDVANDLRWLRETSGGAPAPGLRPRPGRGRTLALAAAGGLAMAAVGAGVMWRLRPQAPAVPALLARLSLDVRPAEALSAGGVRPSVMRTPGGARTALTWTPDGQTLVFVGRRGGVQQLYVRRLDAVEARPLPNTDGAQVPAVSPDGQWVAFWADGAVKKVPMGGGPVADVAAKVGLPVRLVWDDRGRVWFDGDDGRIWAIPPEGPPEAVTTVREGEVGQLLPWPLPGGRVLLYTVVKRDWTWSEEEVVAQTLATGARTVLLKDAVDARYVPSGHLVFLRRGVLFAVPFDIERLQIRGAAVAVLDGVAQALTADNAGDVTGAGQYAVATTGTLAWVASPVVPYRDATLVTVDRGGLVAALSAPGRSYFPYVRVSPDGRRLAVLVRTLTELSLRVYDLDRGTLTVLTRDGEVTFPVWTPDGRHLVFTWLTHGRRSLAMRPADGTAPPQALLTGYFVPSSFTPDGRQLTALSGRLARARLPGEADLVTVTLENGKASVQPLVATSAPGAWPEISPDGRWLAYGSDESGRNEVYLRPYPGPGSATQVSLDGGGSPAWRPNGRELFFVGLPDPAGQRRMLAVDVPAGSSPRVGRPRPLFAFDERDLLLAGLATRFYDVAPDGQRFYGVQFQASPPPPPVTHINLMLNWLEELKAKVPSGTR